MFLKWRKPQERCVDKDVADSRKEGVTKKKNFEIKSLQTPSSTLIRSERDFSLARALQTLFASSHVLVLNYPFDQNFWNRLRRKEGMLAVLYLGGGQSFATNGNLEFAAPSIKSLTPSLVPLDICPKMVKKKTDQSHHQLLQLNRQSSCLLRWWWWRFSLCSWFSLALRDVNAHVILLSQIMISRMRQ